MTTEINGDGYRRILEELFSESPDDLRKFVESFKCKLSLEERTKYLHGRLEEQRDKEMVDFTKFSKIRLGDFTFMIPQSSDGLKISVLEQYQRSERSLISCVGEMAINGVTTRRLKQVTDAFFGFPVSAQTVSLLSEELDEALKLWRGRQLNEAYRYLILDTRCVKARVEGTIVDQLVIIAAGVDENGYRRIIDFIIADSGDELIAWRKFFKTLEARGLHGLKMVVSDDYPGLRRALKSCFKGVVWQSCQDCFMKNAMKRAPKKDLKVLIDLIKEIFAAKDMAKALTAKNEFLSCFSTKYHDVSHWVEENLEDCLSIFNFPESHRKHLRNSNMLSRPRIEVNKSANLIEIFPSREAAERMVGAVLIDQDEEWITRRKYLKGMLPNTI